MKIQGKKEMKIQVKDCLFAHRNRKPIMQTFKDA